MDPVDKKKTVKYFFDTAPDCRNERVKNTWLFTSCEILLMSKYIQNVGLELCLCYHRYIHL